MRKNGYLTVYMALMMGVMISLILGLVEGVRYKAGEVESKCASEAALNAVMAEYSRGLKEVADIYALDMTYGTSEASLQSIENRFAMYAMDNLQLKDSRARDFLRLQIKDCNIGHVGFITDDNGVIFRKQAVESWEYTHGLGEAMALIDVIELLNSNNLLGEGIGDLKAATQTQIHEYDGQEIELNGSKVQVEIEDPTYELESLRNTGVLPLVLDISEVSTKCLNSNGSYGDRLNRGITNVGNVEVAAEGNLAELADRLVFCQYLCDQMGYYGQNSEDSGGKALEYQAEYILAGKSSDGENLNSVVLKISGIRELANLVYLLTDELKCQEAEALALTISAVLVVPELQGLFKTSILLSWAYAESLYDISQLLKGNRVPLLKTADSWHFGLEEALNRVTEGLEELASDPERFCEEDTDRGIIDGLTYRDYLIILLAMSDLDRITIRAITLIEADVRLVQGNEAFRMDNCVGILRVNARYGNSRGYYHDTSCRGTY